METIKQYTYILLFGILGFLAQIIVHAAGEMGYLFLLVRDFETWSFGLSWDALLVAHAVWTYGLILLGVGIGLWQGAYWWRRIYVANIRNLN